MKIYIDAHDMIDLMTTHRINSEVKNTSIYGEPIKELMDEEEDSTHKHKLVCKFCGEEFKGYFKKQKYCNERCSANDRNKIKFEGKLITRPEKLLILYKRGLTFEQIAKVMKYAGPESVQSVLTKALQMNLEDKDD